MEVQKNEVKYVYQNKFRTGRQEAQLEAELEELKNPKQPEAEPEKKEVSAEEETWKKRYGDLRSYSQKQMDDLNKKINDLSATIEAQAKKEIKYPKTEEEVSDWSKKFPDIYQIFKTMAMKEVQEAKKELDEVKTEIKQNKHLQERQKAFQKLLEFHPDFVEIIKTEEWKTWLSAQRQGVQDTINVNETDPYSASETVDLYKYYLVKKGTPKKEADTRREAAQSVQIKSSTPDVGGDKKNWSESRVKALSDRDYARYRAEIAEARANGTFIFDLSEAAY